MNDGGSPITGYVIEKREKGSPRWIKAGETGPHDTKGTADNLDEGVEYEFRVRAVNAAGPGEPSAASNSVITKPRRRKKLPFYILYFILINHLLQLLQRLTDVPSTTSLLRKENQFTLTLKLLANLHLKLLGIMMTKPLFQGEISVLIIFHITPSSSTKNPNARTLEFTKFKLPINMVKIPLKLKSQ